MVCIAILNWNGYQDTIECLKSLKQMDYEDYFVVVGDNGSTNNSLAEIETACEMYLIPYSKAGVEMEENTPIQKRSVVLYDLKDNHGFAKGNNLIVKYGLRYAPDYYLLLNNDTVVEPDFLSELVRFQKKNVDYKILTPLIYYYYDKHLIWNGGGNIYWGYRKYHYADKTTQQIAEKTYISCSFITGCAMFVSSCLVTNKPFFTERFFHGEEDFDFSLRMKKKHIKMACVLSSKIFHKVNIATKEFNDMGKNYIHYLSRFINMRSHMSPISYFLWKKVYTLYLVYLLHKTGMPYLDIRLLLHKICIESRKRNSVTKEYFFECLHSHNLLNEI